MRGLPSSLAAMPRLVRQFFAALLTVTVLLGAGAASAEASPHAGMAMMANMPCGEQAPAHNMPSHTMPCGHECCLGVLGCAALASGTAAIIPVAFSIPQSAWPGARHPDGMSFKPALPPPIV